MTLQELAKKTNVLSETYFISCSEETHMAGAENKAMVADANEAALKEFEAGLARSIKQYKSGQVETFDNVDDLLADLHSPE